MIGIDTNVLLRWLLDIEADAAQRRIVARFMATTEDRIYISVPVLMETIWNLRRRYGVDRDGVVALVRTLLSSGQIEMSEDRAVRAALDQFARSSCDFADLLIAALNRAAGCSTTLTFDRAAARLDGFTAIG